MIALVILLALFGFVVYLIVTYVPMPAPLKQAIIVIAVILIALYLIQVFGLDLPLPRLHNGR